MLALKLPGPSVIVSAEPGKRQGWSKSVTSSWELAWGGCNLVLKQDGLAWDHYAGHQLDGWASWGPVALLIVPAPLMQP